MSNEPKNNWNIDFSRHLGKTITLEGKAVDAKLGAILMDDSGNEIWVDGLDSWPHGYYKGGSEGAKVRVMGTVIERYDLPVFIQENDIMKTGITVPTGTDLKKASHRFLLSNAKWEIME